MSVQRQPLSGHAASLEHGENPVSTGLSPEQLADFLEDASKIWRERSNLSVELLRALCRLSRQRPGDAAAGFTPIELCEEIRQTKKGWLKTSDPEEISKRIRTEFKALREVLAGKAEYLSGRAAELGYVAIPGVDRDEGGGSGRPTRYRLQACPLSGQVATEESSSTPLHDRSVVRYDCEDSREAQGIWRLVNLFSGTRRSRYVFVGIGLVALLLGLGLVGLALLIFTYAQFSWQTTRALASVAGMLFLLYLAFGPLMRVLWLRVVSAPGWLQSEDDDRLIEWRCPPRWPEKSVRLVRYSGTCPLCGGRIAVKRRGWLVSDDLVGRCEEAPRAHVFTFDHVLRRGYLE